MKTSFCLHCAKTLRCSSIQNLLTSGITSPKEMSCKSQKLMLKHGLIQMSSPGIYHLLPSAVIAMEKLIDIVDKEMRKIGGEKIIMPGLSPGHLWRKTGRWEVVGKELFTLKDRAHSDYCLAPTHEEAITEMLSHHHTALSYKLFPLKLYQITTKFRDEMRPRFGLLRGKEFLMKDMYTFDISDSNAKETYDEVCRAYKNIFRSLGIPFVKVKGSSGNIGGNISHEFHFAAKTGEDELLICKKCRNGMNAEVADSAKLCSHCGEEMETLHGIEVAHAFLLGDRYSRPFNASYKSKEGKFQLLQMGCFGLGISRTLAAVLEVLSSEESLRWPLPIAPLLICVITPKAGSKEESTRQFAYDIALSLNQLSRLTDNVTVDDRQQLTIGRRVADAKHSGIPYIIVIGKKAMESMPKIEVIDVYKEDTIIVTHSEMMDFFRNLQF